MLDPVYAMPSTEQAGGPHGPSGLRGQLGEITDALQTWARVSPVLEASSTHTHTHTRVCVCVCFDIVTLLPILFIKRL